MDEVGRLMLVAGCMKSMVPFVGCTLPVDVADGVGVAGCTERVSDTGCTKTLDALDCTPVDVTGVAARSPAELEVGLSRGMVITDMLPAPGVGNDPPPLAWADAGVHLQTPTRARTRTHSLRANHISQDVFTGQ